MKFAKDLDENAVPEWKEKYLSYKQGKKRLKLVARAIRNADRRPRAPTPFANSLRDAPVYRRKDGARAAQPDSSDSNAPVFPIRSRSDVSAPSARQETQPQPNGEDAGERTPRATGRPLFLNERSALQGPKDRKDGEARRERQGIRRYGSIIGSPPRADSPVMTELERQASLLELPDPALEPNQPKADQERGHEGDLSPRSPEQQRRTGPPSGQMGHTGNAYRVAKLQDTPSTARLPIRHRSIFQPKRVNSMPTDSRPFMKRMLSLGGLPTPRHDRTGNDVALEAYREIDFRQAEFFLFLDKELEKIETFYKTKEAEATERLKVLREQLHVMRNQRLTEFVETEQHKRAYLNANGPQAVVRSPRRRIASAPWLGSVPDVVEHIDDALKKVRTGHVGKTSEAMRELSTPPFPPQRYDQGRRDYSKKPAQKEVPYRNAKRKLKIALAEYYRGLELLKSYALLNRTAFRKINKKFDKTVSARPSGRYMAEKVNLAHFVQSEVLDGHIHAVEDLYARYFERGNHKVAVGKLRAKIARSGDYTGSIWRQGVLTAAGCVFGVEGLVYGAEQLFDPDPVLATQASYLLQIYAGYFLMLLLVWLFVLNARAFVRAKVNYLFIFEFDTRHVLDWRQLSEMPATFTFLLGLVVWLNFNRFEGETMFIYWPVILIGLSTLLLFCPIPGFYHRSRGWFLYSNWRLLLAGLYPVEFRDFFLGDMYCSQTYALGNLELFFCLYAHHWSNPAQCNSSHSRLFGFLTTLPGIWRALQCIRRYWDTRNVFPHLVNCGKYTFTILSYMSISLFRLDRTYSLKAFFMLCFTVNSIYCSIWDVVMDWSLGDPYAQKPFLRQTLAYKNTWWYYVAMLLDPILRFNWIFYVIYADDNQHSSLVSFFVAFSEVLRRGMWTLFRVENEHCTNVGRYRASRDAPLPYEISQQSTESLICKNSDEVPLAGRTPPEPRPQSQPQPLTEPPSIGLDLSHQSTRTTGHDVETQQPAGTPSLRMRRRASIATDSPVARALRRVGSTMLHAHAQDYERKRKPELGDAQADSDDEDEERSSDSDEGAMADATAPRRDGHRNGYDWETREVGRNDQHDKRLEVQGQETSRTETRAAQDALKRAGDGSKRS